jgi:hypothetical protein
MRTTSDRRRAGRAAWDGRVAAISRGAGAGSPPFASGEGKPLSVVMRECGQRHLLEPYRTTGEPGTVRGRPRGWRVTSSTGAHRAGRSWGPASSRVAADARVPGESSRHDAGRQDRKSFATPYFPHATARDDPGTMRRAADAGGDGGHSVMLRRGLGLVVVLCPRETTAPTPARAGERNTIDSRPRSAGA